MKTLLIALLFLPLIGMSQTYNCEFSKAPGTYRSNGNILAQEGEGTTQEASHSLNSTTRVDFFGTGYSVSLETMVEDGEFSADIVIRKDDMVMMRTGYYDAQGAPQFFSLDFTILGFSGNCDCER